MTLTCCHLPLKDDDAFRWLVLCVRPWYYVSNVYTSSKKQAGHRLSETHDASEQYVGVES
jgi:hypothetical protein